MKLLAVKNDTHCIFSVSHYDYRTYENLMVDGGQPGAFNWSGYNRYNGELCWIELQKVKFSTLYNDYALSKGDRKYGIHKLDKVKILEEKDWPDTTSFEWKKSTALWKTYGKSGKATPRYINLVDADLNHLHNILTLLELRKYQTNSFKVDETISIVNSIIADKNHE